MYPICYNVNSLGLCKSIIWGKNFGHQERPLRFDTIFLCLLCFDDYEEVHLYTGTYV